MRSSRLLGDRTDVHDMAGTFEMAWWSRRGTGRHSAIPDPSRSRAKAMEDATQNLKDSIKERPKIDKLAALVRQEFGARS